LIPRFQRPHRGQVRGDNVQQSVQLSQPLLPQPGTQEIADHVVHGKAAAGAILRYQGKLGQEPAQPAGSSAGQGGEIVMIAGDQGKPPVLLSAGLSVQADLGRVAREVTGWQAVAGPMPERPTQPRLRTSQKVASPAAGTFAAEIGVTRIPATEPGQGGEPAGPPPGPRPSDRARSGLAAGGTTASRAASPAPRRETGVYARFWLTTNPSVAPVRSR
jgi:hypothetical protein